MKFYKFTFIVFLFIIIFINFNTIYLNSISKDNNAPKIQIVTPTNSQQYIISKPTIKVKFYDENKIDLSSIKLYLNNVDVTKKAVIQKDNIVYTPDKKLKKGIQIAKLVIADIADNKNCKEWYFSVGTPIYKSFSGSYLNAFKLSLYQSPNQILIFNIDTNKDYDNLFTLDLDKIYKDLFYKNDLICAFNPSSSNLNSFNYMKYSAYGDFVFNLIDITSLKNSSPFYTALYNEALDNGWHISPYSSKYTTKILSANLDKASLLEGIKNKRTYVTNNKNINIEFSINDQTMGSTIKNATKLNFNISIVDSLKSNKIENICVISNNNKIVKKLNYNSNLAKLDFTLNKFDTPSYYYLIINQKNNKTTITAPIWVE